MNTQMLDARLRGIEDVTIDLDNRIEALTETVREATLECATRIDALLKNSNKRIDAFESDTKRMLALGVNLEAQITTQDTAIEAIDQSIQVQAEALDTHDKSIAAHAQKLDLLYRLLSETQEQLRKLTISLDDHRLQTINSDAEIKRRIALARSETDTRARSIEDRLDAVHKQPGWVNYVHAGDLDAHVDRRIHHALARAVVRLDPRLGANADHGVVSVVVNEAGDRVIRSSPRVEPSKNPKGDDYPAR